MAKYDYHDVKGTVARMSKFGHGFSLIENPDLYYNAYNASDITGVDEGYEVSFRYYQKESRGKVYNNVSGTVKVLSNKEEITLKNGEIVEKTITPTATTSTLVKDFPVPATHRSMSIIRQNSLAHAVETMKLFVTQDTFNSESINLSPSPEDLGYKIITLAKVFENYSSGNDIVEEATEEFNEAITEAKAGNADSLLQLMKSVSA
mgnify:CR=1 FL=1